MEPRLLKNLLILTKLSIIIAVLLTAYLVCYCLLPYLGKVVKCLLEYLLPLLAAFLLALLIEPAVEKMQRSLRLSREIAVFLSLTALWGGGVLILLAVIGRLTSELSQLYRYLFNYSGWVEEEISRWIQKIQEIYLSFNLPAPVREILMQNLDYVVLEARDIIQASFAALVKFIADLPELAVIFLLATAGAFFISRDKEEIIRLLLRWTSPENGLKLRRLAGEMGGMLLGFLKAQMLLLLLTTAIAVCGFFLLGVKYAVTLGVVAGLLDIVPVLGPGMLLVPWLLLQFALGNWAFGCGLLILYGIMIIVRQFVEVRLIASTVGLHPLAALLSIYIGFKAGGFWGVILALFLLLVLKLLYKSGIISGNACQARI